MPVDSGYKCAGSELLGRFFCRQSLWIASSFVRDIARQFAFARFVCECLNTHVGVLGCSNQKRLRGRARIRHSRFVHDDRLMGCAYDYSR